MALAPFQCFGVSIGVSWKTFLWRLVLLTCSAAFLGQVGALIFHQIKPSKTEIFTEQKSLDAVDWPIIFRLCFKNAFNLEQMQKAGYTSQITYFLGKSLHNENIYGWAGHSKDGHQGDGIESKNMIKNRKKILHQLMFQEQ